MTFSNQATIPDSTYNNYKIVNDAYSCLVPGSVTTVKVNGTIQTTGFVVEGAGGNIYFPVALTSGDVVTVSGFAQPMTQAGGFFEWSIDMDIDNVDVTTFESAGWKEFLNVLVSWSGKAQRYWGDSMFWEALAAEAPMCLVFYLQTGSTKDRLQTYGLIKKLSYDVPVTGVVKESIDLQGSGALFYRQN